MPPRGKGLSALKAVRNNNQFVAFLRGINVGGNKIVSMTELRYLFESLGFEKVRTLLNSGNVIFEAGITGEVDLTKRIEEAFLKKFGFESKTMVRPLAEIEALLAAQPFKGVKVDKDTKLYVTFLQKSVKGTLMLPYGSRKGDFQILKRIDRAVFFLTRKTFHTLDAMAYMEEHFGKEITTRNWNTIQKLTNTLPDK